ncbi:MAG TPA: nucleotidyltransferase family protein [Bryobacteraceae bacterium]|nr:nucleotidyltransferase family protein [Bryobacteraceae bacterium]HXR78438.1 nucleotidyltransferase family protein [Bryobacteraceae bacterium]
MWGIIPAAGIGSRIQPLAFSKELLPLSGHSDCYERPRAVSEYLLERMVAGGIEKVCFIIAPGKADIVNYFGGSALGAQIFYCVQEKALGLCDAIFRALPLIPANEHVCIGLPDTVWFPENGLKQLPDGILSLLLFPVSQPQHFDAVVTDSRGDVIEVQVKQSNPDTTWIWGAMKMTGGILNDLHRLWLESRDEYLGTVINEYLSQGGRVSGIKAGASYVDVGTLRGYHEALRMLAARRDAERLLCEAS